MLTTLTSIAFLLAIFCIFTAIRAKYGEQAHRNAYAIMVGSFVILDGIIGSIFLASFLTALLIFVYYMDKMLDARNIALYIALQKELDKYVNAGWGNVYKANEIRGEMGRIWSKLPESKKQIVLQYEKSLDNAQKA